MRTFLALIFFATVFADDYLNEVSQRCEITKRTYFCTKYKIFKYIDYYSGIGNVSLTSDSSVQLVQMPQRDNSSSAFSAASRQYVARDSELTKIVKFFKRRIAKVLNRGMSVELPEGAEVVVEEVPEARGVLAKGKKEKKLIIIPILMMLKLFKIKVLTALVLIGVVVIKKMLLTAAFILPGVVAAIKHHCKAQQLHVVPYHAEDEHAYTHSHEHESDDNSYASYLGSYGAGGGDKYKKRLSYY